jgi:hypothetical protein
MESAIRKKDGLLKKYSRVIVRDNASRRETVYGKEGGGND